MASVTIRKTAFGTVHHARVRVRGHLPQSKVFQRKTDAVRWANSTEAAIRERRDFPGSQRGRHSVADAIDRYLQDLPLRQLRDERNRRRHLAWWRKELGHVRLCDLTAPLIVEKRDHLLRTTVFANRKTIKAPLQRRKPATVRRYLAALSHVLGVAECDWAWMARSPMQNVAKPAESRGRVRHLGEAELKRLLDACACSRNNDLYTIVVLALATGMRRGEMLNLRWHHVDLDLGNVTLNDTKNGERRVVPVVAEALGLLRKRAGSPAATRELVFPGRDPAKPVDIKRAWTDAVGQADLLDFRFHDLRHTTASYLAMQGSSALEIAAVLGHRTMQMVQRYAHLSVERSRQNLEKMTQERLPAVARSA